MPTPTDNHNLDVGYVEGESWDYNDEFQTIEERLVVRDTEANLSNYTPHSAATFIATDTGAVYDGDGTNWNAATRSYASVDTGELSNIHILDPNASDWGAAVNSKAAEMSQGDVLLVPPVEYDCATTATPDKAIGITSMSTGVRDSTHPHPTITKTADVPIIETQTSSEAGNLADTFIALSNLRFQGSGADTTSGIIIHGQTNVENVTVREMGSHGIHLEQTSGDNLNGSRLSGIRGRDNTDDLVHVGTDGSTSVKNTNGMRIDIQSSRSDGRACNIDVGFGNYVNVQVMEMGGGVRIDDDSNRVQVGHSEVSTAPSVEFGPASEACYGVVYYFNSASADVFTDNGTLNNYDIPYHGAGDFHHPAGEFILDGAPVTLSDGQQIQNETAQGGAVSFEHHDDIADSSSVQLYSGSAELLGIAVVNSINGDGVGLFALTGSVGQSATEISDPEGLFSDSLGTAGGVNIGWDGSKYVIQNNSGGSRDFAVVLMHANKF